MRTRLGSTTTREDFRQTRKPTIAVIAAVGLNRVAGIRGRMPWSLPEDLVHFRKLTWGHSIVMGSRTYASINKPLPGRQNIVLTSDSQKSQPDVIFASSLTLALELANLPEPVFVIGGERPWSEAMPIAESLYLTEIQASFLGDTFFPAVDAEQWLEVDRKTSFSEKQSGFQYSFVEYRRNYIKTLDV